MNKIIKDEYGYHTYIHCLCYDFDHLVRFSFFMDDDEPIKEQANISFYLEFHASAFPYPDEAYTDPMIWLKKTIFYFKNIWWAIKGRPNKYHSTAYWEVNEAKQIKEFIEYCLNEYDKR